MLVKVPLTYPFVTGAEQQIGRISFYISENSTKRTCQPDFINTAVLNKNL